MPAIDYEDIFHTAEVGIALNDPETGLVGTVNEHYANLLGYDRDELAEIPITAISADDPAFDQAAAMDRIQRALEGETQQFDWLFERKDGSRFWGEVVLKRTPIDQDDYLLAFVRDISDRKQYEEELEQKNRRLSEFASIVSHDLRNPLNVATGHLEFVADDCDSDHVDVVDRALERMGMLIDDLLELARAGNAIGDPEPIDLREHVEQCWGAVDTDDAELVVETTATVVADPQRLRQLFENLFRNSVEHGSTGSRRGSRDDDAVQHGGAAVRVTVGDLPDGFYVEDTGPGIAVDDRQQVFEPGFTTAADGTGFGLAIVHDIALAHGWDVEVRDGGTGGARFAFTGVSTTE